MLRRISILSGLLSQFWRRGPLRIQRWCVRLEGGYRFVLVGFLRVMRCFRTRRARFGGLIWYLKGAILLALCRGNAGRVIGLNSFVILPPNDPCLFFVLIITFCYVIILYKYSKVLIRKGSETRNIYIAMRNGWQWLDIGLKGAVRLKNTCQHQRTVKTGFIR